jgi:hypothetical protein
MSITQTQLFPDDPDVWKPGTGKRACGRNPDAGPGTCWLWWDGCAGAEKAGCYQAWARQKHAEGKVHAGGGRAVLPEAKP